MSGLYGDPDDGLTPSQVALAGAGILGAAVFAFAAAFAASYGVARLVGDALARRFGSAHNPSRSSA